MTTLSEIIETITRPGEFVSLCHSDGTGFHPRHGARERLLAWTPSQDRNFWFGPNPVREVFLPAPEGKTGGRESEQDVTRLATLSADLDVKDGALPTFDAAQQVIDSVSTKIGTRPVFVIMSGHGLSPLWQIDPDDEKALVHGTEDTKRLRAINVRFGRLVAIAVAEHGGKPDTTHDLCRIRRVPGSVNMKPGMDPVHATAVEDTGRPLLVDEVDDALNAYGIPETPEDSIMATEVVSAPSGWEFAASTTPFITAMIAGWAEDVPTERNPWAFSQSIRLECALRLGRISGEDYERGYDVLQKRLLWLLENTGQRRSPLPGDSVAGMVLRARARAASKTDESAAAEVGGQSMVSDDDLFANATVIMPATGSAGQEVAPPWRKFSWNDFGNADRLMYRHGRVLRWVEDQEKWAAYSGGVWDFGKLRGDGAAQETIRAMIALESDLYSDVAGSGPTSTTAKPKSERDEFVAWAKSAHSFARQQATAKVAAASGRITTHSQSFDRNPMLLNASNGVIDLTNGDLLPHDPALLMSKVTETAYAPGARSELWEKYLARVMPSPDMRNYLQRIVGYSLTGRTDEQVFFLHHGKTKNGKSVFLDIMEALLGDYAQTVAQGVLTETKNEQHTTGVARMQGRRMLLLSETAQGNRLNEQIIKRLSGGDTVTARGLYQDDREFKMVGKVHLVTNHLPHINYDEATIRRIRLVHWSQTITPGERDPMLTEKLRATEMTGILAWAVEGTRMWLQDGLQPPVEAQVDTAEYVEAEDVFGRFLMDCAVEGNEEARASNDLIRGAYTAWCAQEGIDPMRGDTLSKELVRRGFSRWRTMHGRGFSLTIRHPLNQMP